MSYSQKIKNLLLHMKKSNNYNKFKDINFSKNGLNNKNNKPLIKEDKFEKSAIKPLPYKKNKNKNKYQESNENKIINDIIEYPLYDNYNHIVVYNQLSSHIV